MVLSNFILGWLTGIIDGEGYISFYMYTPVIRINMTDEDIIIRLAKIFSSKYYRRVKKGYKPIFCIAIYGKQVIDLLSIILPYLSKRRAKKSRWVIKQWNKTSKKDNKIYYNFDNFNQVDFDTGWITGIIEGEGYIGSGRVQVHMTDIDTIEKVSNILKKPYYIRKHPRNKTMYRISTYSGDAVNLLRRIKKYLGMRRKMAANFLLKNYMINKTNRLKVQIKYEKRNNKIKNLYKQGDYSQRDLACVFKIDQARIWRIING